MIQAQITIDRFLRSSLSTQYKLNVYERMLLVMLASYTSSKSDCFPSHLSLATYCGMSIDSVKSYTKTLEGKGLIKISRYFGKNNHYQLFIPSADSTQCSQHPVPVAPPTQCSQLLVPGADSTTNNISNNIRECTSGISLKKRQANKPTKTNKSSFPEKMEIGESHRTIATQSGLDVEAEFIHFREYHLSRGAKFSRWDMAFNTWLRNATKFTKKNLIQQQIQCQELYE